MSNKSKILENTFALPKEKYSKKYAIEVRQRVVSKGYESNNVTTFEVEKKFIKKDDFGFLFSIVVLDRKQSNIEGLRGMEDYLSKIQDEITLYTDEKGNIKTIVNYKEVFGKWMNCKSKFLKKYKHVDDIKGIAQRITTTFDVKEEFLNLFRQSEIGTLLFPPIYIPELKQNKTAVQHKFYRDFFGPYLLPFRLEINAIKPKKGIETTIGRVGEIDKHFLEEDKIKLYYRKLHSTYNLIVDIESAYTEIFNVDNSNIIDNAFQLFGVKLGSFYSFDKITTIKS